MTGRTVATPDGETWRVRRVWAPRLGDESIWARLRRRTRLGRGLLRGVGESGDPGCLVDALDDLILVLVIVIVVAFAFLVGIPLLLALLDLVALVLLTVLGIAARMVFRRPWIVEAEGPAGRRVTWRVVGWRASGETVDAAADALVRGIPLPPGLESPPAVDAPTDA